MDAWNLVLVANKKLQVELFRLTLWLIGVNFLFPAAAGDYGVVAHEHPTKEDLFDLDWDQVDERYDPRLLSEDLINESQSDSDHKDDSRRRQAEHCYFEARKYEHGQKVSAAPILHYVPPPLSQA